MAKRKLKIIPIYRFFLIMDLPSKIAFGVLFLGLLGLCVGTVISAEDPVQWSLEVVEVPAQEKTIVPLVEYKSNYRTMSAEAQAYRENVISGPRMIVPKSWMVYALVVALALGWGTVLTAATYIKGYAIYGAFLLYAMFTMIERMFEPVLPEMGLFVSFGLVVLTVLPGFLLHQGYLKLKFIPRLLLFLTLVGVPYIVVHEMAGWEALHRASAESFQVYLFLSLAFIVFVANDLNNIFLYLATNARKRKYRAKPPIMAGIFIVLLGLQFMMLQDAMDWELVEIPEDFPFRPMHLVAFSALIMVGTKQNLYPTLREYITNRGMSFALLGLGLIAMGILFFHSMIGEILYQYSIERIILIAFFLTSLFHLIYIYVNFGVLLRARVNFYFISMMPRKLMFFFVVMATFLIGFGMEASHGFQSRPSFSSAVYHRLADAYMVEGDRIQAMGYYNAGVGVAEGCVKGNYNRAILLWTLANDPEGAEKHFLQSRQFLPFAPSYLNLAALELEVGVPTQAKYYLQKGLSKLDDPYLHNNLGQVYLLLENPDSAIIHTKEALLLDPDNSTFYGNLATIYMTYERYDEAVKYYELGLDCDPVSPITATNALYMNLAHGTSLEVDEAVVQRPEVRNHLPAWFNLAIDRFRKKEFGQTRAVLDSLTASLDRGLPDSLKGSFRPPELLFLDGCVMFEEGEVSSAISRMAFLDANYPSFKPFTQHFLGAAYHGKGLSGMAGRFFRASVENGRPTDLLNETLMEIDRGNHDFAFLQLNQVRAQDSTLAPLVLREETLLQLSRGEYLMASIGFDISSLSGDEWTRVGLYAGQIGNIPAALEAFRNLINQDSSLVTPYLEMGRISLANQDPLARENLQAGLDKEPDNIELQTEMARAHLQARDREKGLQLGKKVLARGSELPEVKLLEAELALAEQDTQKAIILLDTLQRRYPLMEKAVIQLSTLLRLTDQEIEAQNTVINSMELNQVSPALELELARVEKDLGRIGEAAQAAIRAMGLEVSLERSRKIGEEFAAEIELFRSGEDEFFGLFDEEEDFEE